MDDFAFMLENIGVPDRQTAPRPLASGGRTKLPLKLSCDEPHTGEPALEPNKEGPHEALIAHAMTAGAARRMSTMENGTSADGVRSVTDAELDAVTGGFIVHAAALVGGFLIGYGAMSLGLDLGEKLQTGTLGAGLH